MSKSNQKFSTLSAEVRTAQVLWFFFDTTPCTEPFSIAKVLQEGESKWGPVIWRYEDCRLSVLKRGCAREVCAGLGMGEAQMCSLT